MKNKTILTIEQQTRQYISECFEADDTVRYALWFKNSKVVRVIFVYPEASPFLPEDKQIYSFYFNAVPEKGYLYPFKISNIQPKEIGKVKLERGWGKWSDAIKIKRPKT